MENNKIYAKILDFWSPNKDSGEPIGLIATTYTFDSDFFEKECLYRFLKLESDPEEDGPVYLIEREEKLNSIKCEIFVDQKHIVKKRNLRWDIIPIRLKKGILHSKITILYWSNHIRILITSANISSEGYRKNKEIISVLDFYPNSTSPVEAFNNIINHIGTIIEKDIFSDDLIKNRAKELLANIKQSVGNWKINEVNDTKNNFHIYPILILPGEDNFFDKLIDIWSSYSGNIPASNMIITSPFYNSPDSKNEPSIKAWEFLRKRGQASIHYNCKGSVVPTENKVYLNAPKSLLNIPRGRNDVTVTFSRIPEEESINNKTETRPLHLKSYYIENENDLAMYVIGSSNFTSSGLGLIETCNYEANVAYVVNKSRNKILYKELSDCIPEGDLINIDNIHWPPVVQEEEDDIEGDILLHNFFKNAILIKDKLYKIVFSFNTNIEPPNAFNIKTENNEELISYDFWESKNRPDNIIIDWNDIYPPSGFNVFWEGLTKPCILPLNVSDFKILPSPKELKDLPLEVLANILTSAKPAFLIIKKWMSRKRKSSGEAYNIIFDPHKRIDTHNFLLQKTRKYSIAINSIKNKLEQPLYSLEALDWRINGPIGIKAFINAILKESNTSEEKLFFISEILLCLKDIKPKKSQNTINIDFIYDIINKLISKEIEDHINTLNSSTNNIEIKKYSKRILRETKEILNNKI